MVILAAAAGSSYAIAIDPAPVRLDNAAKKSTVRDMTVIPPGQYVRPLNAQVTRGLSGQMMRALPGQLVPLLPGQLVPALPGQVVRALPGQIVQALPGQLDQHLWVP